MRNRSVHRSEQNGTAVNIVAPRVLTSRRNQINGMIAKRAFELYEHRGKAPGKDVDDWLQAEHEILHWCRHDLRDSENSIVLRAEIPSSYKANELQVSIEDGRLMVCGERDVEVTCANGGEIRTESQPQRIFRSHELPTGVDPSAAEAVLKNNVLTVTIPKINQPKPKA